MLAGRGAHVSPAGPSARDSSRQEPRIPGNSGSRSVAPVNIPAPAAAPAPAKAAVELAPSSSRGVNNGSQSARATRDDEARAAEASRRADRREDMPTGHVGPQGPQGPPGYPQAPQGQRQQLPPLAPAVSALGAGALPPLEPIQGPSRCARIHTPSSTNFDTVH